MIPRLFFCALFLLSWPAGDAVRGKALEPEPEELEPLLEEYHMPTHKKRVLVVIDVMSGYDADFVSTFSGPGGLAKITKTHSVSKSYKLGPWNKEKKQVVARTFKPGEKNVSYDKGWNRGIDGDQVKALAKRVNAELDKGAEAWDLIVYTYDYLDPESLGTFPLDDKSWTDPSKEIALVPYKKFLTIVAHNEGAEVDDKLAPHPHCLKHGHGIFKVNSTNILCFRKQVDDAFNDAMVEGAFPKNVDVDDNGKPNKVGKTLLETLSHADFSPDEASLTFVGILTNRCVQSSLNHACADGYDVSILTEGSMASDESRQNRGLRLVQEHCPKATIM
eukprot:TRINITY_DN19142_c0_g2_i1.p1 TRINITY_DN19142_c0_g2~~TRINITY_DN19142_c0_g2_i1.p1  ORF type:complete len:360 (+),score=59.52 TRINITY_DN19142_c0_g2_i1:83-1081(+)